MTEDQGFQRTPTLVVALTLEGRPALLVGCDEEAVKKGEKLLDAGARLTLVSTACPEALRVRAARGELRWFSRSVCETDLVGQHVVVLSDRDAELAAWLRARRRRHGFLLSTVDQPRFGDFYFTARVQAGPVELALASGGSAPLLLRRMREQLQRGFDEQFQQFASRMARLRASLADVTAGERRGRLQRALEGFAIEVRLSYPAQEGQEVERPRAIPPSVGQLGRETQGGDGECE